MSFARVCACLFVLGLALTACRDRDVDVTPLQTLTLDSPCEIRSGCTGRHGDLSVYVHTAPYPRALKPFSIFLSSNTPLDSVSVRLDMQDMDMGQNHYRLLQKTDGNWQAEITLPLCTSGRSDWIAVFEWQVSARHYQLSVPFIL